MPRISTRVPPSGSLHLVVDRLEPTGRTGEGYRSLSVMTAATSCMTCGFTTTLAVLVTVLAQLRIVAGKAVNLSVRNHVKERPVKMA